MQNLSSEAWESMDRKMYVFKKLAKIKSFLKKNLYWYLI